MVGLAAPCRAQDASPTPADIDRSAREAFSRGEFERAARLFEQADAIAPHPATRYNAALSWEQAGRPARAADAYQLSLESGKLDESQGAHARARLSELKRMLGVLSIDEPVGAVVSVAHVRDQPIPMTVYLEPGTYHVELRLDDGRRLDEDVSLRAAESSRLSIEVPPKSSTAPPEPTKTQAGAQLEAGSGQRSLGYITLGLGAASAAGAAVLGIYTIKAVDDFKATGNTDADLRDKAITLRTATNVAWAASAALAGVGIWLVLDSPKPARSSVGLRGSELVWRLRF